MNTYLLEADRLDGDWKIMTYLKEFGTQAYFVNIPSKFVGADGVTMWLRWSPRADPAPCRFHPANGRPRTAP